MDVAAGILLGLVLGAAWIYLQHRPTAFDRHDASEAPDSLLADFHAAGLYTEDEKRERRRAQREDYAAWLGRDANGSAYGPHGELGRLGLMLEEGARYQAIEARGMLGAFAGLQAEQANERQQDRARALQAEILARLTNQPRIPRA